MNLRRNLAVVLMFILVVTFESADSYSAYKYDVGDPLYLTPLLEAGQADSAREKASVPLRDIESYAGYFTVDKKFDSNLFFWYFPAKENARTAPVVLYVGSGNSLTLVFSLSLQNGPFSINMYYRMEKRNESWNNKQNLIYIDSTVGTGYSFTNSIDGYSTTYTQVANNLLIAVQQFFQLFPSLRENDFFVAGEGHVGKTVSLLSHSIHLHNAHVAYDEKINLKGLAIASAILVPVEKIDKSEYYYAFGLLDENGRDQVLNESKAVDNGISTLDKYKSLVNQLSGYKKAFNILKVTEDFHSLRHFLGWVEEDGIRACLHVGNKSFVGSSAEVMAHLESDYNYNANLILATILEYYQVLIYSGQLDMLNPYLTVRKNVEELSWSGAKKFKNATRQQWRDANGELAGYIKKAGNLKEVLVRNAGYLTSFDQPQWTLELMEKFTHGSL